MQICEHQMPEEDRSKLGVLIPRHQYGYSSHFWSSGSTWTVPQLPVLNPPQSMTLLITFIVLILQRLYYELVIAPHLPVTACWPLIENGWWPQCRNPEAKMFQALMKPKERHIVNIWIEYLHVSWARYPILRLTLSRLGCQKDSAPWLASIDL